MCARYLHRFAYCSRECRHILQKKNKIESKSKRASDASILVRRFLCESSKFDKHAFIDQNQLHFSWKTVRGYLLSAQQTCRKLQFDGNAEINRPLFSFSEAFIRVGRRAKARKGERDSIRTDDMKLCMRFVVLRIAQTIHDSAHSAHTCVYHGLGIFELVYFCDSSSSSLREITREKNIFRKQFSKHHIPEHFM